MSMNHVIVWLDQSEAYILHFNAEASESQMLRAHPRHPHLHTKAGDRHSTGDTHYLESIANLLSDATEILITGPAQEKLVFSKHLAAHHPHIAAKVVGVESADHPSAGQLLAHAKKYFAKADLFR